MSKIDEIIKGMQNANSPSDYWITSEVEFPELKASQLFIQRKNQSIYEHTMRVIDLLTIKNHITLLSSLFHDLGKSNILLQQNSLKKTKLSDFAKLYHFYQHCIESADIARIRLTEWGASSYLIDRVIRIVLTHMYDIVGAIREKTIQKFIADVGQDNIENWFTVRKADSMAYSRRNRYERHLIDPFYNDVKKCLDKLPHGNNPVQLQSKPNMGISGKECKSDDTFLTMEGA